MAQAVAAGEALHVIGIVDIVGAADVLDDLQAGADRDDRGGALQVVSHLPGLAGEVHHNPVVVSDHFVVDDLGAVSGEDLLDPG